MVSVGQEACDQMKFSLAEELGRGPQFVMVILAQIHAFGFVEVSK